jgi:hypothetical protein
MKLQARRERKEARREIYLERLRTQNEKALGVVNTKEMPEPLVAQEVLVEEPAFEMAGIETPTATEELVAEVSVVEESVVEVPEVLLEEESQQVADEGEPVAEEPEMKASTEDLESPVLEKPKKRGKKKKA